MINVCEECGKEFSLKRFRKKCFECMPKKRKFKTQEERTATRRRQIAKTMQKRRNRMKQLAVDYKGGKCVVCGYNKSKRALQFHHVFPNTKLFGISEHNLTHSWEEIRSELDKCILVCSNCHCEIHDGLINASDYFKVNENANI